MTVDLLGPASLNAVTSRPARTNTRGAVNTWFQDCSTPTSTDGTTFSSDWFNDMLAQLRTAMVDAGIALDNADDMLWRAIQSYSIRYAVDTGAVNALVITNSPAVQSYRAGMAFLVEVLVQNNGAATINVDGLGAKPIVALGSALGGAEMRADYDALLVYDGSAFVLVNPAAPALAILHAAFSFFVDAALGSDANDGLAAGAGHAFATIQKGVNAASFLNANGFQITIHVADGAYPAPVNVNQVTNGTLYIKGNSATPANCLLNPTGQSTVFGVRGVGVSVWVDGFKLSNASGSCLTSQIGGNINFLNIDFGFATGAHISCDSGQAVCNGNYTISGNASYHILVQYGEMILNPSPPNTITFSGSLGFTNAFVACADLGFVRAGSSITFAGGVTAGARYVVSGNAVIDTGGAGASYFPGTTAGSTSSGGQYL